MRRVEVLLVWLLLLALTGCAAKQPPATAPGAPSPATPPAAETPTPPPPAEEPAAPTGPRVVKEGAALRLQGLPDPIGLTWAPGGQTAFVAGQYRLRLDTLELHPIADLGSYRLAGPGPTPPCCSGGPPSPRPSASFR